MSSSAVRSQGTIVRISTAEAAADVITGITAANPPVVTANAHGMSNGAVVVIRSVVGMIELNDRAFVIANVAANTFELKGVDATGYTAYVSGGTATAQTMTEIANCRNGQLFEGDTPQIDKTNVRSLRREYDLDIPDSGTCTFQIDPFDTDPGQVALKAAHNSGNTKAFSVVKRDGSAAAFMGLVRNFPQSFGVSQHWQSTVNIQVTGQEAWFA